MVLNFNNKDYSFKKFISIYYDFKLLALKIY